MKILCVKCGEVVAEGDIENRTRKSANGLTHSRKCFVLSGELAESKADYIRGEIRMNRSKNPENWTGLCSNCQKNEAH